VAGRLPVRMQSIQFRRWRAVTSVPSGAGCRKTSFQEADVRFGLLLCLASSVSLNHDEAVLVTMISRAPGSVGLWNLGDLRPCKQPFWIAELPPDWKSFGTS